MSLNNRCIQILMFLLSQEKPVKINQLKENYKVSERTIRYDLNEIKYWLKKQELGTLEVIYAGGVTISCSHENRESLLKLFQDKLPNDYFYSSDERRKIILLELLNAEEPLKIETLQNRLFVSRGTIIKELKTIEHWVGKYKLSLIRKPNYGIEIQGEESAKRSALLGIAKDFMTTEQILNMINSHELAHGSFAQPYSIYAIPHTKILFNIDLPSLEESLYKLQELLGMQLGDNTFANLFTHLTIALQRIKAGKGIFLPSEELEMLEKTTEFKIAEEFSRLLEDRFNIAIPKSEIGYITLHILGSQMNQTCSGNEKAQNLFTKENSACKYDAAVLLSGKNEINYYEMARDIIQFVEELLNIKFKNTEQLLLDLSIHLKPAINRCKYNMSLINPLLEDINRRYYRVFLVVKEAFLLLRVKYPFEMNDHEISYIVLHFAAEIEKEKVKYYKKLNVLLICASGVGTAKILNNRLAANFRDLNIVKTISYLDFLKEDESNIDLVISTMNIKSAKLPCIVVNPLLNEDDIINIGEYLLKDAIADSKKKDSCEFSPIEEDFEPDNQTSLIDLLTENTIKLNIPVSDWEEAIEAGADILYRNNYIEYSYITALKDTVRSMGSYIVIAPGFALSHAKPKDGVLKLGASLIRLANPICFGHKDNDPVKLVFTLAPIDNISHHKALSELMKILLNKSEFNVLLDSYNMKDILRCIHAK